MSKTKLLHSPGLLDGGFSAFLRLLESDPVLLESVLDDDESAHADARCASHVAGAAAASLRTALLRPA